MILGSGRGKHFSVDFFVLLFKFAALFVFFPRSTWTWVISADFMHELPLQKLQEYLRNSIEVY